jgi:hypothetical protein
MMRPNLIETQGHAGDFKKYEATRQLIGIPVLRRGVGRGLGVSRVANFVFRY